MATLASSEAAVVDKVHTGLYIGGQWRDATGGGTLPVEDPATGETLAEVADATVEDAQAALASAHETFATWKHTPPRDRAEILRRAFELVMGRADELALLMTLEMGKPVKESRAEIAYAANFLRWNSEEAVRISGRYGHNEAGAGRVLTMQQPVGPCLFITPWNFPMAMGTRKIGPAVAAGCTMVVKPAKQTPLSMLALAAIFEEAGLPAGVLNVVTAKSSGRTMEPLIKDPRTRKLSFTGSTEVGKVLIAQAADQVLRVSMELGGNAPFLVFADADMDAAIDGAMIAEQFAERFAERMGGLKVARGTEEGTDVGPLIDDDQRSKVAELVEDARAQGGEIVVGGRKVDGPGYFYAPTVITGVAPGARMLDEEIFGPVAPITTFSDDDEAIAAANRTEYGLVAYVYTQDLKRSIRVIEGLETGMVGLNQGLVSNAGAPFGGIKQSGFGREGGPEGIQEYLDTKYVAMNV
jgi:succinate-semialdehyde dehydrogenase/glutarate-semialdehyde dehydrogenase